MTLYQFKTLDEREQREAVEDAVHIDERMDQDHWILLYHLGDFYVEVFYNKTTYVIVDYNAFETTERLQPYLDKIDITSVLQ